MVVEIININGVMTPHTIIPIISDKACLFRAISFALYDTQLMAREVRAEIVGYVMSHWDDFSIMSHDSHGNNYSSSVEYFDDMSRFNTYGGLCELVAAGQIFPLTFEVYYNGELYEKFGVEGNPVKRLHFSSMQDLSHGHFDVYLPYEDELSTSIFNSVNSDRIPLRNVLKNLVLDLRTQLGRKSSYKLLLNTNKRIQKFTEQQQQLNTNKKSRS
ncbi:OTU domain-containing protein 1-like [Centruroides sculpturatus]|uniref:OTU domain-containing protein 1-like n=1 Tax=Centruroides sculpturatus TaxID=218467 RepID=UPI000C6CFA7A|nr:OTU domain-containing protein 1-like [Centruroides sculpturatus]